MYLQLDTKFNPFTYDEMVKPLLYYKQAYDEAEAAYSDLVTQTEAWKDIANRERSPEAFEMYQRYSGDLSRAVDDFSRGMTSKNRRALLGLKRRYAQDITPIARASEEMNAANELRAKAGPDAIFEVGEYNSLDQFLHGKTANNKYQSREALTKKTAAMTEAAMAEALKDPEFKKAMGDQFWMITQHTGGSYDELIEAMKLGMMDNPIAQNRFSQIRQKVARNSGIQNYDAAGQQAIMEAINTGLYAGLDKPVRNFQSNQDHITPYQSMNLSLSAANAGMEWDREKKKWVFNPDNSPAIQKIREKAALSGSDTKNWIPEVVNGSSTGRYYDPVIKKYFNSDGTIAQQGAYKPNTPDATAFKPLFFDAWSGGASKGFQMKMDINDQDSGWGPWTDTSEIKYSDIHGKEARKAIKDYIYNIAGIPGTVDISDGTVEAIADVLQISRDRDWFSDNHFAVRMPGVDDDGNIISKPDFERAKQKIIEQLSTDISLSNALPK